MNHERGILEVVDLLKDAKSILFITGAGVSTDSGLPTYRGKNGMYNNSVTPEGIPIETVLAGDTLEANPDITWKYLSEIEQKCRNARFNRAHGIIAEMERHFERVWVLTQNVDGFHQAAGSRNVIEIHGNLHRLICPECMWQDEVLDYGSLSIPPLCPKCNAIVRPKVVLFGEPLPYDQCQILMRELDAGFDICFSIGTTSVFYYIAEPIRVAKAQGRSTIEINPEETEVSEIVDIKIPMGAAEALEFVWNEYEKQIQ